jgi:hypothetical protein
MEYFEIPMQFNRTSNRDFLFPVLFSGAAFSHFFNVGFGNAAILAVNKKVIQ